MNQKAAALGLENTHFENPHELDAEEHYTTAYELALITRELLSHPLLGTICATRKTTIPQGDAPDARLLVNHNKLLRNYAGCIGVKTGFTKRSGRCLVSAAEREGLTLIAVTLNAPDDWNDHTKLLDAGFDAYERVVLCERGGYETPIPVTGGKEAYVVVHNDRLAAVTLPRKRGAVRCTVELPRFLFATVDQNETVGCLIFWCDTDGDGAEEVLATVPLTTAYAVERKPTKGVLWRLFFRLRHH
jgi:D-alanyl-D-alanine carboxypeptidase/D-alanyl-D-alanine carboxypeptidase (penicillin-binding protein 5/6)